MNTTNDSDIAVSRKVVHDRTFADFPEGGTAKLLLIEAMHMGEEEVMVFTTASAGSETPFTTAQFAGAVERGEYESTIYTGTRTRRRTGAIPRGDHRRALEMRSEFSERCRKAYGGVLSENVCPIQAGDDPNIEMFASHLSVPYAWKFERSDSRVSAKLMVGGMCLSSFSEDLKARSFTGHTPNLHEPHRILPVFWGEAVKVSDSTIARGLDDFAAMPDEGLTAEVSEKRVAGLMWDIQDALSDDSDIVERVNKTRRAMILSAMAEMSRDSGEMVN